MGKGGDGMVWAKKEALNPIGSSVPAN